MVAFSDSDTISGLLQPDSVPRATAMAIVEALRSGTVNRPVARHLSVGREDMLDRLWRHISDNPEGSAQVVVGRYGTGKTHLAERFVDLVESRGYSVARVELGAAHGRPENPRGVLQSIESSLRLCIDGNLLHFPDEWPFVRLALEIPRWWPYGVTPELQGIHRQHSGRSNLWLRYRLIRQVLGHRFCEDLRYLREWPYPHDDVPYPMTAANHAVAATNALAHLLREAGSRGLVILFDEAERSEWAQTAYRAERAGDLLMGFARAASNLSTDHLKHYRDILHPVYRPQAPSLVHCVFFFTWLGGNATWLANAVGATPIRIPPLSRLERQNLERHIRMVYGDAYSCDGLALDQHSRRLVDQRLDDEDVRMFVRTLVAALDYQRLHRGRR